MLERSLGPWQPGPMRHPAASPARGARSSQRGAFGRQLGLALVLHALGLALVAVLPPAAWERAPGALTPSEPSDVAALEFELEGEPGQQSEPAPLAAPAAPAARPSSARPTLAAASAGASASSRAADDLSVAAELAAAEPAAREGSAELAAEPGTDEAGDGTDATDSVPALPHAEAPRLSLDALGVGAGHNPFLGPSSSPSPSTAQGLGRHIDHVLRSGLAEHDRELGLGPEGPVVALVTDLVMQSESAPNTSALLGLRTDANGYTVDVEVREASGETAAWEAVAAELKRKLAGQRLRVPTGSGGVSMQLRVVSRNTLPSGADPGLAIDLFGLPIKSGDGPRSTRVQILTPKIAVQEVEAPYGDGRQKVQALTATLAIVAVMGDPVDIGAVARRVVHAHLVALETHPKEQEAAPSQPH